MGQDAGLVLLGALRADIASHRRALLDHPIYDRVDSLPRLRAFMRHHVFAVWDFMCLAKRLQRDLTSLDVLWLPPRAPRLARFINTVILAEESDLDERGEPMSHVEMYLAAMQEVGAPLGEFQRFLERLGAGASVEEALTVARAPACARSFVEDTLRTVEQGTTLEVLASFLFGREDPIPCMFARFLPCWQGSRSAPRFTHYVRRHIEVDSNEHGPAAERAILWLAGADEHAWRSATLAARNALQSRLALWNALHRDLLLVPGTRLVSPAGSEEEHRGEDRHAQKEPVVDEARWVPRQIARPTALSPAEG